MSLIVGRRRQDVREDQEKAVRQRARSSDVARRHAQWKKYQGRMDPRHLVFIHEAWAKTNVARTRAGALRSCRRIAESMAHAGRSSSPLAYYKHVLAPPVLGPGAIAVFDNVRGHKGQAVRRAIETSACANHLSSSGFASTRTDRALQDARWIGGQHGWPEPMLWICGGDG